MDATKQARKLQKANDWETTLEHSKAVGRDSLTSLLKTNIEQGATGALTEEERKRRCEILSEPHAPIHSKRTKKEGKLRVAIVGAGIAGCGAAWALTKAGHEVVIYERAAVLGGNARVLKWDILEGQPTTGVSVHGWPAVYWNYTKLLNELNVTIVPHALTYYTNTKNRGVLMNSPNDPSPLRESLKSDFEKWEKICQKVIATDPRPTLYNFSALNKYAYINLKELTEWEGISHDFWKYVVTPVYSFGILSENIDSLPSAIVRGVERTFALGFVNDIPTYKYSSAQVFPGMTAASDVRLSSPVTKVKRDKQGVHVTSLQNNPQGKQVEVEEKFDKIIFACPANVITGIVTDSSFLERKLLSNFKYEADVFEGGYVHTDDSIIPPEHREKALTTSHYFEEHDDGTWEYTIILSDLPIIIDRKKEGFNDPPMFATYNSRKKIDPAKIVQTIDNVGRVPAFTFVNHAISKGISFIQGHKHTYHCGSATTPGDCHDFSFVSGLVAAYAIDHTSYPYSDDPQCKGDFDNMRGWMGI
eukprot:TRINITY_DN11507_c0_g1_i1.p1 TRINITY_DN11507_c0_g1~~TRINITY_DN11507_c0_g1_i1.p1  ORF type:complete len:531 (+),score=104.78 TRINITY_DN11507_c0_g1_i1:77-1669(+)